MLKLSSTSWQVDLRSLHLSLAAEAVRELARFPGFEVPTRNELVAGRRPPPRNIEEVEPGTHLGGWAITRLLLGWSGTSVIT